MVKQDKLSFPHTQYAWQNTHFFIKNLLHPQFYIAISVTYQSKLLNVKSLEIKEKIEKEDRKIEMKIEKANRKIEKKR